MLQPVKLCLGHHSPRCEMWRPPKNFRVSKEEPQLSITILLLPAGPGVGGRVRGNPATLRVAQGPAEEARSGC